MRLALLTPQGKRDYLVEAVVEGLLELGHELVPSDPGNGLDARRMDDDEWVETASSCDALIAFFGKARDVPPPRLHLVERVRLPRERKAYVDGAEWRADGWHTAEQVARSLVDPSARRGEPWLNEEMLRACGSYLKRECYPQDLERGVVPLPFALCARHVQEPREKDIDVLCSFGHVKTGLRKEAIEVVQAFKDSLGPTSTVKVVVRNDLSPVDYKNHLRRSRIVIDALGGGDSCDRFWEGVGAQACVLYQRYNIEFPDPFVDWKHAVSWSTPEELSVNLRRLVYGSEAEIIAVEGFKHAKNHHTAWLRAQKILDCCHVNCGNSDL